MSIGKTKGFLYWLNRLVMYVLQDWAQANSDVLLDKNARHRLADKVNEAYLNNKLV